VRKGAIFIEKNRKKKRKKMVKKEKKTGKNKPRSPTW